MKRRSSQLHCRSGGSGSCWRSLRSSCMRFAATISECPIRVPETTKPRSAEGLSPRHTASPSSEMPGGAEVTPSELEAMPH